MGELVRNNIRERYLDLMDWVDIRPDFNMVWAVAIGAVIIAMGYLLPSSMMIAATIFAVLGAIALTILGFLLAGIYVAFDALTEVLRQRRVKMAKAEDRKPAWYRKLEKAY